MSLLQLPAGKIINGEFAIQRPLAEGGMGAVFVALQQSTGVQRALKLMHPSIVLDSKLRERFVREARIGASIPSDHVVQVIGAGIDADSELPYLVMELLAGENLAEWIERRGKMDLSTFALTFEQLCHALSAAHRLGIVHRDLKPENLFLADSRSAGAPLTLKVLDFGIAKLVADSNTLPTQAIGTPLWMAPEQTERGGPIGPEADVWALGLLAFYCLTGKHYWRCVEQEDAGLPAVLRELLLQELVAPDERARELGVSLPPGFAGWFRRCVQREPRARFAHASEAHAALRGWLSAARAPLTTGTEPMPPPPRIAPTEPLPPLPSRRLAPTEPLPPLPSRRLAPTEPLLRPRLQAPATSELQPPGSDSTLSERRRRQRATTPGPRNERRLLSALAGCALLGLATLAFTLLPRGSPPRRWPEAPSVLTPAAIAAPLPAANGSGARRHPMGPASPGGTGFWTARSAEPACASGNTSACVALGDMCSLGSGGVAQDLARASALYRQACNGGEPSACQRLQLLSSAR